MPSYIEIEGDLVTVYDKTVTSLCKLADLLPNLAVPPALTTPHLPRGTVFLNHDEPHGQLSIAVELEPGLRHLRTESMSIGYRLAMPWQYFIFAFNTNRTPWTFTNYKLYWSATRLTSPTQTSLVRAYLPNIYGNGDICFGSTAPASDAGLSERVDTIINTFFTPESNFNSDLGWNRPNGYTNFRDWARDSKANPFCWRDWPELDPASGRWCLNDVFGSVFDRGTDTHVADGIPDITTGFTFGRAQQWLETISPDNRWLLAEAFKRLDPAFTLAEPAPPETDSDDDLRPATTTAAPNTAAVTIPADADEEDNREDWPCACDECNDCPCDDGTYEGWICGNCEEGDHEH